VAAEWLRRCGNDPLDIARGLILLPTRRAARALAEAFLRASEGRPLLLPRITAFGALDETPLALAGALDLPPAVKPTQRLATLTRLILAMDGANGAPQTADRAWRLAGELAGLMDEAELAGVDLVTALPHAADAEFAAHWNETLRFLHIVTGTWPEWLDGQGLMNPAARQVGLLDAQARAWAENPPLEPVVAAGATGGIPAVARLLRIVSRLPTGAVVLPGLDLELDDEAWTALDTSHPQAGMRGLLADLGATRGDVRLWSGANSPVPPQRSALLRRALLPAAALVSWRQNAGHARPAEEYAGLHRLHAADQHEEAAAIALILREALETAGARTALVTPDRDLAGRVSAELLRYGVIADDSAGETLADTPPAVFLRLLVRAVAEELAPVPLLALLKHPLAGAGLAPAKCRAAARELELLCLRGPRPAPGLSGLRWALHDSRREGDRSAAADFLARVERCLEPALRIAASPVAPALVIDPSLALAALIQSAERLAETDDSPGPARLWAAEEGEALATLLADVQAALPLIPEQPRASLPGLLDAVLEGSVVRSRRALRGRTDGSGEHPRVFIWGLLEARLQSTDLVVLGGLAETVWPPATDPGPWMSRPMRARAGLPSPEERVGQAAHDFVSAACAAPEVVLSCPRRRDGAPAVPARWLERLRAYLEGRGERLPEHPAAAWARLLDQPQGAPVPVAPPSPCPPVRLRPRRLRVTEIETVLRDPYAIYARHVLGLWKLDALDEGTDAADYGSILHDGLHRFLREHGPAWPEDAPLLLARAMDRALMERRLRPALTAWWGPRIARIAAWVAGEESKRRASRPPVAIVSEVKGAWDFGRPGGPFTLIGRADRIERDEDGQLAILDYKTGVPPGPRYVEAGLAPQLPLEACMAEEGAFGPELRSAATELTYWHLTGGYVPGEVCSLFRGNPERIAECIATSKASFLALIDSFDDPARCYLSQPHPARAPRFPQYAQLARVAEWTAAGEDE
jgi:ATP-dependent helicase/nuclease subunit B